MKQKPLVCSYYFPNWHCDPRIEALHGKGWNEWRVTQYATPRFPGHQQPKVPLWGYQDESKPEVMTQKISAAAAYGVDAFLWDWYWFSDGPYRQRALEEGFLKASNNDKIKFAIMWANHDPIYAHPGSYWKPAEVNWSGAVDAETFRKCTDYCIQNFLNKPNYLRCYGDKLYFGIFRPQAMAEETGGLDAFAGLLREFRDKVRKAGLGELHLEARLSDSPKYFKALEEDAHDFSPVNDFLKKAGFDGTFNYCHPYVGFDFPSVDYGEWMRRIRPLTGIINKNLSVPYNPLVQMGWDCSPRTVQSDMFEKRPYPFGTVAVNNTPERFQEELQYVKDTFESGETTAEMVTIACWNEWTEGAYLEPDARYGYAYLQAIRNVFKPSDA